MDDHMLNNVDDDVLDEEMAEVREGAVIAAPEKAAQKAETQAMSWRAPKTTKQHLKIRRRM